MRHPEAAPCHSCKASPVHLWMRRPTGQETAAYVAEIRRQRRDDLHLPGELADQAIAAMYGEPHVAVTGCAEHHLGDDPADADSGLDRRALLHAADCGGHGACACSADRTADTHGGDS